MAKYRMEEMNDLNGTGRRQLYPRMEITGQVDLKELARSISGGTTFTPGDVIGVVGTLQQRIAQYMAEGKVVKIDGIGTFTASLKLRKGCEPEFADSSDTRRNARSVRVGGVIFRPAKELVSDINMLFHPIRSTRKSRRSSSEYTSEQRLALAVKFLEQAPYLTVADYCRLTGLLHSMAAKELHKWATTPESGIDSSGTGSHRVYVRKIVQQNEGADK